MIGRLIQYQCVVLAKDEFGERQPAFLSTAQHGDRLEDFTSTKQESGQISSQGFVRVRWGYGPHLFQHIQTWTEARKSLCIVANFYVLPELDTTLQRFLQTQNRFQHRCF